MGLTKVTAKLTSLADPKKSFESLFLVDTGATDSMVPSDELETLGIKKEGKMAYELADGTIREYSFGLLRIEFMGETTAGRVIFAAPGTEPLLAGGILLSMPGSASHDEGRDKDRSGSGRGTTGLHTAGLRVSTDLV
jgi:hypothetical protein